ncbi:N-acetylmuramoyl-L-alanine amidase [Sinorhizobium meliloti]|uniref:N-acetylmuramoyl-L-alanine amidase n=1 Tax=Rhizobium meliloti TaxID=382 RepID=UPI00299EB39E|nr:SH3 domain-containing protein [Sinorhizobium meliloti]
MEVKYHKLVGADFIQSPNGGESITPKFLVMHYTAGYDAKSAIDTFKRRISEVSAHLVIDTDGKITQMMPFNRKAWHAGPSIFRGVKNLNSHSIGFEFVNIGFLKKTANGFIDAYGNTVREDRFDDYVIAKQPIVGSGEYHWPVYPKVQIEAGLDAAKAIIDTYDIEGIASHEEIDTRGWKTDPGPAFPMKSFQNLLGAARRDPSQAAQNIPHNVDVSSLNVRGGPGADWSVIAGLKRGDRVYAVNTQGNWTRVLYAGGEGWVSSQYLERA